MPILRKRAWTPAALLLGALWTAGPAVAADANGDFALEGVALIECSRFAADVEGDKREVLLYGGYIQGYVTALNQTRPNTYDLLTWHSPQVQFLALLNFCKQNPDQRLYQAVAAMVARLEPDRIQTKSTPISIEVPDGRPLVRYPETLARIRNLLIEQGYHEALADGVEAGAWDADLGQALTAFQDANELAATGLPDDATLVKLLY